MWSVPRLRGRPESEALCWPSGCTAGLTKSRQSIGSSLSSRQSGSFFFAPASNRVVIFRLSNRATANSNGLSIARTVLRNRFKRLDPLNPGWMPLSEISWSAASLARPIRSEPIVFPAVTGPHPPMIRANRAWDARATKGSPSSPKFKKSFVLSVSLW